MKFTKTTDDEGNGFVSQLCHKFCLPIKRTFLPSTNNGILPSSVVGRKAQTVFLDLFFAVGFFLLLIGLILITSINLKYKAEQNTIRDDLERQGILISDLLAQSPGYPTAWELNSSGAEVFGFAGPDRRIVYSKLVEFKKLADLNYTKAKQVMGIEGEEFFLQLRNPSGTTVIATGNTTPEGHIINIRRAVLYGNSSAQLIFLIWRLEK
ncbi:MAG: hypothetical protein V1839_01335 [archaeon]